MFAFEKKIVFKKMKSVNIPMYKYCVHVFRIGYYAGEKGG